MYPPGASNVSYVQNCNCVLWKLLLFSESLHKEKLVMCWAVWFIKSLMWSFILDKKIMTRMDKVFSGGKVPSKEACIVHTALFSEFGMSTF